MFEDEVSFRQDPTLFRSWFRVGNQPQIPTFGQPNTQHIYGAIRIIPLGRFSYHFVGNGDKCNAKTYQTFLNMLVRKSYPQKLFLIQDNASYHKNPEMLSWFKTHAQDIKYILLPAYSPELNAAEPLWGYTRREATHNQFFPRLDDLVSSVKAAFQKIQYHPKLIANYLTPYN